MSVPESESGTKPGLDEGSGVQSFGRPTTEVVVSMPEPDPVKPRAVIEVTPPTGWDTRSFTALRAIIKEDMAANSRGWMVPAKHMLVVHRFGEWANAQCWPVRPVATTVFRLLNTYVRNFLGFEVHHTTKIGRRVVFVHQHGVVLQPNSEIGDGCMLYHNVTIGRRWDDFRPTAFRSPPKIGKGVHLGVGSTVIGAVRIGDGAKVGPHCLVTMDVPAGASVVSPPSRVLRLR